MLLLDGRRYGVVVADGVNFDRDGRVGDHDIKFRVGGSVVACGSACRRIERAPINIDSPKRKGPTFVGPVWG
jgi:hypothetical protein